MPNKKNSSSILTGWAALITAVAALITAVGFPDIIPNVVQRVSFVSPPNKKTSAAQFLRDYYSHINKKNFARAWAMLTPEFQVESSTSYSFYANFYEKYESIEVQDVHLISQSPQTAIVEAKVIYLLSDNVGITESPQHFTLTWEEDIEDWRISDRVKYSNASS